MMHLCANRQSPTFHQTHNSTIRDHKATTRKSEWNLLKDQRTIGTKFPGSISQDKFCRGFLAFDRTRLLLLANGHDMKEEKMFLSGTWLGYKWNTNWLVQLLKTDFLLAVPGICHDGQEVNIAEVPSSRWTYPEPLLYVVSENQDEGQLLRREWNGQRGKKHWALIPVDHFWVGSQNPIHLIGRREALRIGGLPFLITTHKVCWYVVWH